MVQDSPAIAPEYRRRIDLATWNRRELPIPFDTTPEERRAIADHLGLVSLHSLEGEAVVRSWRGRGAIVSGRFTARVVQTCVVTLNPVEASIEQSFERRYLPEDLIERDAAADLRARDIEVELSSEDPPEPLSAGGIELGDAVVEELSLALDPFPRCDGAVVEQTADPDKDAKVHPFAALQQLKTQG